MEPDDDLPIPGGVPVPPLPYSNEPPAPPLVHRLKSIFSDWRYPAALAAAMLITSVVIAQLITVRGYVEVLDRLEDRARINDARATAARAGTGARRTSVRRRPASAARATATSADPKLPAPLF